MGSARGVWATLSLPPLMACVVSQSTLFRFQVALQGLCLKRPLGCMHFPGLSHSGSGSRVLHKGTDLVGPAFCAFPGPRSSGNQVLDECTLLRWDSAFYHLPCPSRSVSRVRRESAISGVPCVSSGELISADPPSAGGSTIQDPKKSWLATGSLLTVWKRTLSLGQKLLIAFRLWLSPTCLPASSGGSAGPLPASFHLVLAQSFVL